MRTILAALVGLVVAATGVLLFVWLLWWLWNREQEAVQEIEIEVPAPSPGERPEPECEEPPRVVPEPVGAEEEKVQRRRAAASPSGKADDLKRIEGIGPKIASVLKEAGISTFSDLAETDVERINEILEEADPRLSRLADPSTWSEQAAVAASGDWAALASLQSELKRGRRN